MVGGLFDGPEHCAVADASTQSSTATAAPMAIPTSSAASTSPGPHAQFAPEAVSHKPNQHSPPRAKSPMPPTASLTDAGLTMLNGGGDVNATSSSAEMHSISPSYKGEGHQASSSLPIPSPPAEVEATLSKLTSHANVAGVLVLSRPEALVIRSGGAYFDPSGPGASDRAVRLKAVVEMVRSTVQGLERDVPKTEMGDELSFLRIRTKRYEMMISPSEKYLLVVIQDPTL